MPAARRPGPQGSNSPERKTMSGSERDPPHCGAPAQVPERSEEQHRERKQIVREQARPGALAPLPSPHAPKPETRP